MKIKSSAAITIFALFVVTIISGCNTAQDTSSSTTSSTTSTTTSSTTTSTVATYGREYFPNTDGYSWTYHVDSFFDPKSFSMTMTFSGTTSVSSLTVQKQRWEYQDQVFPTSEGLYTVDDSTVSYYGTTQSPNMVAMVLLDFPLTIGKTWFYEGTHEATVVTRESVTVPAGIFNDCIMVRFVPSDRQTTYYWYARDVGLVKEVSFHVDGTGTLELTAKNF